MSKVAKPIQLFLRLGKVKILVLYVYAPLAQLVEHLTLNQGVRGSNPDGVPANSRKIYITRFLR